MSENKFDAKVDQLKGSLKEQAGKLKGDKAEETEGSLDKTVAKGKEVLDDVKETFKGAVDKIKKSSDKASK